MAARSRYQLMFARETPETIRAALDELQKIEPAGPKHAESILQRREELLQELALVEGRPF